MSNKPNTKKRNSNKTRNNVAASAPAASASRGFWQSPLFWIVGLVAVAGVASVILVGGGSNSSSGSVPGETAFAEVFGAPLAQIADPDPAIGQPLPAISAQTLQGERVRIDNDGTARVFGFFAHWCPHCQRELPRTVDWLETNDLPDGVEVVAVSSGVDPGAGNYPPSDWFVREEWPALVILDDENGTLSNGLGLSGFPYWVAADSDGNVVARTSGELSIEQFEALIDAASAS